MSDITKVLRKRAQGVSSRAQDAEWLVVSRDLREAAGLIEGLREEIAKLIETLECSLKQEKTR